MKRRAFSILISTVLVILALSLTAICVFAANEGLTFSKTDTQKWRMEDKLDSMPYTFSFKMQVATDATSGRLGIIFSNYDGGSTNNWHGGSTYGARTISFEIHNNGNPRFYYGGDNNGSAKAVDLKFTSLDVRTGDWVYLTFVKESDKVICYLMDASGTKTEALSSEYAYHSQVLDLPFVLGSENRSIHQYPFGGAISEVAVYTKALTQAEVESAYRNGVDTESQSLLVYYDLSKTPTDRIEDKSGNGNSMKLDDLVKKSDSTNTPEEKPSEPVNTRPSDYAYSFAVVGDTQYLVENDVNRGTNNTKTLYDWILANKDSKKIQYVFGLGDITDNHTDVAQWDHVTAAITQLDGNIPYYLVRGNHDASSHFNQYFNNDTYVSQFNDPDLESNRACFFEAGKIDNAYTKFTIGETKYLVMLLDYGANDAVLAWASDVIEKNPTYRVIINTHGYLSSDGSWLDDESYSPDSTGTKDANSGLEMWEKLVSRHRNIFMVLCGHDPYYHGGDILMLRSEGEGGNTVTQLLIDPQSLDYDNPNSDADDNDPQYGMVAMLYFSEDGSRVWVEYISTVLTTEENGDYLHRESNQFSFDLISYEGNGIVNIEHVKREGLVDTYIIFYTNGTYQEYTVTNREGSGAAALAPYIGDNGNWFVGGTDTGISAKGDRGDTGATGDKGDKGDKGDVGPKGESGSAFGITEIVCIAFAAISMLLSLVTLVTVKKKKDQIN